MIDHKLVLDTTSSALGEETAKSNYNVLGNGSSIITLLNLALLFRMCLWRLNTRAYVAWIQSVVIRKCLDCYFFLWSNGIVQSITQILVFNWVVRILVWQFTYLSCRLPYFLKYTKYWWRFTWTTPLIHFNFEGLF